MITLDEIRKNSRTKEKISGCWQTAVDESHSSTRMVLEKISGRMNQKGIIPAMDALSTGKAPELVASGISVYPGSRMEKEIHAEFLGICRQRRLLSRVLREAMRHVSLYSRLPQEIRQNMGNPSITILTDKWNSHVFHRFEARFLQAMLEDGYDFYFFLADDYGVMQIPFLTNRQMEELRRNYHGEQILGVGTEEEMAAYLGIERFSCEYHPPITREKVGKWERYAFTISDHYLIGNDFWTWQAENNDHLEGRIPEEAVKRFLKAAEEIRRALPEDIECDKDMDDHGLRMVIHIFGKKLILTEKTLEMAGSGSNLHRIKTELEVLIRACRKKNEDDKR